MTGKNYIVTNTIIRTLLLILLQWLNKEGMRHARHATNMGNKKFTQKYRRRPGRKKCMQKFHQKPITTGTTLDIQLQIGE